MMSKLFFALAFVLCLSVVFCIPVPPRMAPPSPASLAKDPAIWHHNFNMAYSRGPVKTKTDYGCRVNAIIKYNNVNDTTVATPMPSNSQALQSWGYFLCLSPRLFNLQCDVLDKNNQVLTSKTVVGGSSPCDRVTPAAYYRVEIISRDANLFSSAASLNCKFNVVTLQKNVLAFSAPFTVDTAIPNTAAEVDEMSEIPADHDSHHESSHSHHPHHGKQGDVNVRVSVH